MLGECSFFSLLENFIPNPNAYIGMFWVGMQIFIKILSTNTILLFFFLFYSYIFVPSIVLISIQVFGVDVRRVVDDILFNF